MWKKETSDTSYKQQDGNSEILFLNLVSIDPELAASYNFSELSFVLKTVKWQLKSQDHVYFHFLHSHTADRPVVTSWTFYSFPNSRPGFPLYDKAD